MKINILEMFEIINDVLSFLHVPLNNSLSLSNDKIFNIPLKQFYKLVTEESCFIINYCII